MNGQTALWNQEFISHPCLSCLCKPDGDVHTVNTAAIKLLGSAEETSLHSMFGRDAAKILQSFLSLQEGETIKRSVVFQGEACKVEIRKLDKDFWLRLCTKQDRAEQEERLLNLGSLSGGLFHAIRNPLTIVQGRVELLQMMSTDAGAQSTLQIVYDQCDRIANMLDNTQLIALQPVQSTQFSLNVLLQKTFPNQSTAFVNQTVVSVFNDENRLRIAFELIAEHIFQAGTVSGIEIQRNNEMVQCILSADLDEDGLRFFKDLRHVLRQDVPRQFTSSTREQHIQMLRVILSDCGVDFDCSNQGQIYLSFIDVQQGGDKLKILVVDDDDILRETVVALLSIQGHHILTANTAEEAQVLWDEAIDVVLLDVNLPKMSGTDLLSKIQIQHPLWVQKTILISGIAEFGRPLGIRFLQKPFSKRQLNEAIEQVTSHVRQ